MNQITRCFISYPKSGRTWIRFIFTELGLGDQIRFHHDGFRYAAQDRHLPHDFDLDRRRREYADISKLAYLSRDPRDVMVSLYYQITGRRGRAFKYSATISEFIRDDYFGAETLKRFREMWSVLAAEMNAHIISYEECQADLETAIRKLLAYYELEVDDELLKRTLAKSTFENMRSIEEREEFPENWLRPRNNSFKMREGKIGGFRNHLSEADIDYLNAVFRLEE